MRKQLVKVIRYGTWKVVYDDARKTNPYRVYLNGKKAVDYADLTSCLYYLKEAIERREYGC